jgi:hypothetical protein
MKLPEEITKSKKKKTESEENDPTPTKAVKRKKKTEKNRCPFGHRFGVDTDAYDECDECDVWDDCIEVKENN